MLLRRAVPLLLAVLLPAAATAAHPQTVWDAADLERLRAGRDGTHAALADNLRAYLERHAGADLGGNVAGFAMAARIIADGAWEQAAVAKLAAFCGDSWSSDGDLGQARDLMNGAIAYDVLHELLSPAQRDACRARIAASARGLADLARNGEWWVEDMVQNHNWVNHSAIGLAGQALEGEDPDAAGWQALADANFERIRRILDLIPDGSWHEGIGYMEFGVSRLAVYAVGAARRGRDWDRARMLEALGGYILHLQQPNHPRVHVLTHGDWNWSRPGLIFCLRWAARRFQDPLAEEAARRWDLEPRLTRAEFGLDYALEYVVYDPGVPAVDLGQVPLDLYAADQQAAVVRSDWAYGPDAAGVVAVLKAGVFGGRGNYERMRAPGEPGGSLNFSHDHEDDLGLWIYGNGGWLLPEAAAYNCCTSSSEYHSTVWHNSFLVDGRGQLGDDKLPSWETMAAGRDHPWFFAREAELPLHDSTAHYAFARGEGARLYPPDLGIVRLARLVALSREPAYLALHDRAELAGEHTVEQLFHAQERSGADGPWLRLANQDDVVLGIRVFAPAAPVVAFSQQQSNNHQENLDDDGTFDLVRVSSRGARVGFVELLWPTRGAAWGSRPAAAPLDDAAPEAGFAVPLPGGGAEAWVFASAGGLVLETGELAVVRTAPGGALARLAIVGGGRLADEAGTLLDVPAGTLEVALSGGAAELSGPAAIEGVRFRGPDVQTVTHDGVPVEFTREGDLVVVAGVAPGGPDGGAGPGGAGEDGDGGLLGGCAVGRGGRLPAWLLAVAAVALAGCARRRGRRDHARRGP